MKIFGVRGQWPPSNSGVSADCCGGLVMIGGLAWAAFGGSPALLSARQQRGDANARATERAGSTSPGDAGVKRTVIRSERQKLKRTGSAVPLRRASFKPARGGWRGLAAARAGV